MSNYEIRTAQRHELDFAITLATNEGWNPGLHDADCFYQTDPDGFLIGLLEDQPIACISAVSYGGTFGFIGFYIVKPEYRGQRYGIQIWDAAMKRRSLWIPGIYLRRHSKRAVSKPFPRFRVLCTNSKKPKYSGNFSCEMPRCGLSQDRSKDQNPSIVLTCTSQNPSPSSSRAYSPAL